MKILIDPVYTGRASTCSTSYLAWKVIERIADLRPDAFFYLLVPETQMGSEIERAFVNRMPDRVLPVPHDYIPLDRMAEMFKLNDRLVDLLAPGATPFWDTDVVLTSRIMQIPSMRANLSRETSYEHGTYQAIIGLEEMPIYSFRQTVAWTGKGHFDLQSLGAYQAANAVVISNLWTKRNVLKIAKSWLAPSRARALTDKMHEATPVRLERLQMPAWYKDQAPDPINVVFTGRFTGTRNVKAVAELFRKHFAYAVGRGEVNFVVSTNSQSLTSSDVGEIDFLQVEMNDRQKFHEMLQTRAHVVVNLSKVEDFSLSTYEPLLYGVPVIVSKLEWSEFLGPDYPFRVSGELEAYTMVREFLHDYVGMYKKFRAWERSTWKRIVEGGDNVATAEVVAGLVVSHETELHETLKSSEVGAKYREIVSQIVAEGYDRVDLFAHCVKNGLVMQKDNWRGVPIGKRPCLYLLKVLANMAGYRDTLQPGVVRRV